MIHRKIFFFLICLAAAVTLEAAPFVKFGVRNASGRHAVCNDGSPAVYYLRQPVTKASDTWVIFLGGGGFCYDVASCKERKVSSPELMTSIGTPDTLKLDGLLSDSPTQNPDFHNVNQVVIPYCSSDLWSGARGKSPATGQFEFRGRRIFRAVIQDLQTRTSPSLNSAHRVLLTGTSAGGVGVMVHLDWLATRLPHARVQGLNDAGWTPDIADLPTTITGRSQRTVRFWNGKPDTSCAAANPNGTYHCYTSSAYSFVKMPLMVQMSQHDSVFLDSIGVSPPLDAQEKLLASLFAAAIRNSLEPVAAAFSPRTFTHGSLPHKRFSSQKVRGFTLQELLGIWFFNRAGPVKVIR